MKSVRYLLAPAHLGSPGKKGCKTVVVWWWFYFSLDYFVIVLFAFVALDLVSSVLHQRLAGRMPLK